VLLELVPGLHIPLPHFGGEQFRFPAKCLTTDWEKSRFCARTTDAQYVLRMLGPEITRPPKDGVPNWLLEQGYTPRKILARYGEQYGKDPLVEGPVLWADAIAQIAMDYPTVSVGREGLLYPEVQGVNTEGFFKYLSERLFTHKLSTARNELMMGSDHPINDLASGMQDMMVQAGGSKAFYDMLVEANKKRFLAE